jgi:hypothetical protein
MDETELICVCVLPDYNDRIVVIDFLSNPLTKETERNSLKSAIVKKPMFYCADAQ